MHNVQSPRTDDAGIEAEIQAKGLTAPRITPPMLDENISSINWFTAAAAIKGLGQPVLPEHELLTICVLVLRNGFTVVGKSACASPANFDAEVGQKVSFEDAKQQLWPLMGYALKQRLHEDLALVMAKDLGLQQTSEH